MKQALGLIETIGLAAAVEAADTAVKSANVFLIGYELTRGDGMVTVKIEGDVGAVQAAISAAASAARNVNRVYSARIIPRPSLETDAMVFTPDMVGLRIEITPPAAAAELTDDKDKTAEGKTEIKKTNKKSIDDKKAKSPK